MAVPQSTNSEQCYRTPGWVFEQLQQHLRQQGLKPFALDAAADEHNALCSAFYTEADNALAMDWAADASELGGSVWCNPPFATIGPWVEHAASSAARLPSDLAVVMLLPHNVATDWYVEGARYCETLLLTPRFAYVHPDPERARREYEAKHPGKKWKEAAPSGSMALLFTASTARNPTPHGAPLRVRHVRILKPGSRSKGPKPFAISEQ